MAEVRNLQIGGQVWVNRDDLIRLLEEATPHPVDPALLVKTLRATPDWAEIGVARVRIDEGHEGLFADRARNAEGAP